jgi:phosphate:Na+ symporter
MEALNIIIRILTIVGGLGFFLYGMKLMSESLQKVAGRRMQKILEAIARKPLYGIFTGLIVTAIIQSSSATTVMIVSFANAGLLSLTQSVSVIMGANIGTTVTAWLISLLGFSHLFDINVILLPLLALSLPLFFSRKPHQRTVAEFIIGLVILFMGLYFIKSNVPEVDQSTYFFKHFSSYTDPRFFDILLFVGAGLLLTIIFQSSSATIAFTFVIATEGWISFPLAAAMVLGENIGTTSTAIISSLVANTPAKRAALSHLIFNLIGVIWALILLQPLLYFSDLLAQQIVQQSAFSNPASIPIALSVFHSTFNLVNTLLLVGFIPFIVNLTKQIIPAKDKQEQFQLRYINSTVFSTSEISILQAKKEVSSLAGQVRDMFLMIPHLLMEKRIKKYDKLLKKIEQTEDIVDNAELEIAKYLTKLSDGKLSDTSIKHVRVMLKVIDDLESIADNCNTMARIINNKNTQNAYFTQDLRINLNTLFDMVNAGFEMTEPQKAD